MAVSLTCGCGARLEIDDKFAGQTVYCPDCQRPLQAPKVEAAPAVGLRTSGLALTSFTLALVGAFTILGTLAAAILGAVALVHIARYPQRLTGKGYAVAGIVLGVVMTAGTVFALSSIELFGLSGVINDAQWAGRLDHGGPLEIVREDQGFSIKRPNDRWGVYKPPTGAVVNSELLLVLPAEDIVVLCFSDRVAAGWSLDTCLEEALKKVRNNNNEFEGLFTKASKGKNTTYWDRKSPRRPEPTADGVAWVEVVAEKEIDHHERKTLLIRVYKKQGSDTMYIVVGAARKGNFDRALPQLKEVMDTFKVLNRQQPGW
jgi:hypothetical protein